MSATNRGAVRRESDYYPTPAWCTRRFFEAIGPFWSSVTHWVEPCAGDGAIVEASGRPWGRWTTGDIAPRHESIPQRGYAETLGAMPRRTDCAVVTNPPFGIADEIVRACAGAGRAAILLRLNWLAGSKRARWLRGREPDAVFVLPERPSFTGDGKTDATDYAWFIWDWCYDEDPIKILPSTPLAERRAG